MSEFKEKGLFITFSMCEYVHWLYFNPLGCKNMCALWSGPSEKDLQLSRWECMAYTGLGLLNVDSSDYFVYSQSWLNLNIERINSLNISLASHCVNDRNEKATSYLEYR